MPITRNANAKAEVRAAIAAFLVSPLLPAIVMAWLTPLTSDGPDFHSVIGLALPFYFFAAGHAAVFGWPAFLLGKRLHLIHWWSCVIVGAAVGALGAIIFLLPSGQLFSKDWLENAWGDVLLYTAVGAPSGLLFWLVWRAGTPIPSHDEVS